MCCCSLPVGSSPGKCPLNKRVGGFGTQRNSPHQSAHDRPRFLSNKGRPGQMSGSSFCLGGPDGFGQSGRAFCSICPFQNVELDEPSAARMWLPSARPAHILAVGVRQRLAAHSGDGLCSVVLGYRGGQTQERKGFHNGMDITRQLRDQCHAGQDGFGAQRL